MRKFKIIPATITNSIGEVSDGKRCMVKMKKGWFGTWGYLEGKYNGWSSSDRKLYFKNKDEAIAYIKEFYPQGVIKY